VKEKQEARQVSGHSGWAIILANRPQEYNAAIARGETAALLEQDKRDIFRQKVGNIPPHSRVNIRITCQCARTRDEISLALTRAFVADVADLKVEADGAIRFILPTSVAPRYSPHTEW
jgi:hypothetical protein